MMSKIYDYCSKGFISTNVLAVVDYDGRFLCVYPGAEGCASDSFVLSRCSEFTAGIPCGFYYLGDAGYALTASLLTPYRSTRYHLREWSDDPNGRPQVPKELYNYYHSKTRIIVEQAFGVLKKKWSILSKPMELEMETTNKVIHVCAALHNYVLACNNSSVDDEIDDTAIAVDNNDLDDASAELHAVFAAPRATDWRDNLAQAMWDARNLHTYE